MNDYYEVTINCPAEISDFIISKLSEIGYEGFWESDDGFKAYIPSKGFNEKEILNTLQNYQSKLKINCSLIKQRNWNQLWENSYQPAIIANRFIIKAPFHRVDEDKMISFTIAPKMAFGTGHHQTTDLMIQMMMQIDFKNKSVLDFGTGTGILAIFSEYFGAQDILAIDNDPAAIDCTFENISLNKCKMIRSKVSDLSEITKKPYDIILANINKNVLIEYADQIAKKLTVKGELIISGFYENDINDISSKFESLNLLFKFRIIKDQWAACLFFKQISG
jgi:ribosomal protein L11 methyltransferase